MPHSLLKFVARTNQSLTSTIEPSTSRTNFNDLHAQPMPSHPGSLGNKLQVLAGLSPAHLVSIELLVDHIIASVQAEGRGLLGWGLAGGYLGWINLAHFTWLM